MRLLHLLPMLVGAHPPVEQPARLVLLGGDEGDDLLVEARRRALALDVGDKAVFVALARDLAQRLSVLDGFYGGRTAHGAKVSSEAAGFGAKPAKGGSMSARLTAPSAVPTAWLMRRQCGRVGQKLVRSQSGTWLVHWVRPMAPSIAATSSATEMAEGGRARRYPPAAPRAPATMPAWASAFSTLATVARGSFASSAS